MPPASGSRHMRAGVAAARVTEGSPAALRACRYPEGGGVEAGPDAGAAGAGAAAEDPAASQAGGDDADRDPDFGELLPASLQQGWHQRTCCACCQPHMAVHVGACSPHPALQCHPVILDDRVAIPSTHACGQVKNHRSSQRSPWRGTWETRASSSPTLTTPQVGRAGMRMLAL